jgi:hypothetical protein
MRASFLILEHFPSIPVVHRALSTDLWKLFLHCSVGNYFRIRNVVWGPCKKFEAMEQVLKILEIIRGCKTNPEGLRKNSIGINRGLRDVEKFSSNNTSSSHLSLSLSNVRKAFWSFFAFTRAQRNILQSRERPMGKLELQSTRIASPRFSAVSLLSFTFVY